MLNETFFKVSINVFLSMLQVHLVISCRWVQMGVPHLRVLAWLGGPKFGKKKTWPKVHFASIIVCIVLTHDDKMISIHS